MGMPPPPMMMAGGVPQNVREACEMAGRGVTTNQTTKDIDVTVYDPTGDKIKPDHFESFAEIKEFPREIRDELKKAGFPSPSQIQAYTWPLGIRSKDVIGIAATGSGKTLAFLLPAFAEMHDVGHRPEREGTGLVVMSPTRELAQQTESEASRFGRCLGMRCVAMYGGTPKGEQLSKYRAGCHSIVACPGRLNDFLDGGQVKLNGVIKLVLDEADRMLDMGFEPQIRKILSRMPKKRHTMFFTATWPVEVRELASEILHKPYRVMIGNRDELKGNYDVIQQVQLVEAYSKNERLVQLLHYAGLSEPYSCGKALVFSNTKRMCSTLENCLARTGFPCSSIHGDKDQMQRDAALGGLKDGRIKVLVATDVAARGLDIKGVGLVVNFDPANNAEDYVHRIGRTGRAGARGYAITFLTSADAGKARGIMEVMERTSQHVPPELYQLAGLAREGRNRGRGGDGKGGGKGGGRGGDRSPSRARIARSPRSPSRARVARSPSL
jgi:ATP-dependent RNA helicase DDX5/DBP2